MMTKTKAILNNKLKKMYKCVQQEITKEEKRKKKKEKKKSIK